MEQRGDSVAAIGIDFGTTNSSIARRIDGGKVELVHFPRRGGETESFRSVLYLQQVKERGKTHMSSWAGPAGIEHYLDAEDKGRLIQSLKSHLSSRSLSGTEVFGRRYSLEDSRIRS